MSKHGLSDITIYECILGGAHELIKDTAGQNLPRFTVEYEPSPRGFDEDEDELQIIIQYQEVIDLNGSLWDIERSFSVPEGVLKGIAARRPEDIQTFVDVLLPDYRAELISKRTQSEFHIDVHNFDNESDFLSLSDDERMLSSAEVSELMPRFGTAPWFICDAGVEAVSKELFRLNVVFRNGEASVTASQACADYDLLTLSTSLSWGEYNAAMAGQEQLLSLLCRIHETFIITKADLPGRYSAELQRELERLDWQEENKDDPFTSGELTLDADGRSHFTRDYRG